ncbi:bifunctional precorrin-2 dehydrogenase/sirohydrochlorin ferrochelatase [Cohnella sp. REN36]|uniref:precorrin-2 dehydrogenase/sirohydrochlorin ferrochelatase family protein n=1 Tax=Cohnella sp. REN36 TaxID=2887347 RepID=UPI001D13A760|nr:bifunctional precorrin-2 dehydrogenase/sirohydrochlorin ferrochelatase [Cohnella sp. REN36]MCC3375748.1 bifunctional precorrin-2 dehydrogenase/sirohydrochlorin ferrochelatase [Cohnella sp. REN36]
MPRYYPAMLHLEGRRCVVFGGGAVAERKAAGLLEAGAAVTVVSPSLTARLGAWATDGTIAAVRREGEPADLEGAALAFAATDRPEANGRLAEAARARGVPIAVADDGEAGDFVAPAVVRRGGLLFAVSASGAGPAFAARLARELADRYGPEYGALAATLRRIRAEVRGAVADPAARRRLLRVAVEDEALAEWRRLGPDTDGAVLLARLRVLAADAAETGGES